MEELATDPNAFIRPSPSAGTLGGVANKTRESIILCEAAGFDSIFVETVGVGQSETAVHSMVDFFLLLMLAGAGDELQGIKRGIMEMADAIAITKADGANKQKAMLAKAQYQNALHLFPASESGWLPKVTICSAVEKEGIAEVWHVINQYLSLVQNNGFLNEKRSSQAKHWLHQTIIEALRNSFYNEKSRAERIKFVEKQVIEGKISSFTAAQELLTEYLK